LDTILWWRKGNWASENAWDKILFGTDAPFDKIPIVLRQYKKLFKKFRVPNTTQEKILQGNAYDILGI